MREAYIKRSDTESIDYMIFCFDYDRDIVADVKQIKNRSYDPTTKNWKVAISLVNAKEILAFLKKWKFQLEFSPDSFKEIIRRLKDVQIKEEQEYALPNDSDYLVYAKKTGKLRLFLVFDYSAPLVDEVKEIPGAKFIRNTRRVGWEINVSLENLDKVNEYLSFDHVYCDDKSILDEIKELVEDKKWLTEFSSAISADKQIEIKGLAHSLMPFQQVGVQYALKAKKTFIADDMGCGKTIEALATYQASGANRCLIVCPASVKYNWLYEANKWLPNRKAVVLEFMRGNKNSFIDTGDINIINYDMLTKMLPLIKELKLNMAIFDESHRLIHKKAQWSKSALELSKDLEYCLLLTGTPIVNRTSDLINQLAVIDRINLFGGEWRFKQRYCGLEKTPFGWKSDGATNLDELHSRLRSICFVRRTKNQVLTELPSKIRSYIPVALSSKDKKIYDDAEKDIAGWIISNQDELEKYIAQLSEDELFDLSVFEAETRNKVANAEALIKISKLRRLAALGKMNAFIDWAEDFMKTGKKLVIFGYHRDIVETIKEKFSEYKPVIIHGGINTADRFVSVKKFQENPTVRICVCNLQAGGVGLTLTAASDVAFLEFGWSPGDMFQAEDRCYRIGQQNTVNAYYFFAEDTIDIDMINILQEKSKIIDAATDGVFDSVNRSSMIKNSMFSIMAKHRKK